MKVFIDDIWKWKNEFQEDSKKPSSLNSCTLQSCQTTCNHSIEWANALEKVTTEMCESYGNIEQAYQVALWKHQLLSIIVRGDEPILIYEYLHSMDKIHEQLKE